jgi:hypothetical protein
MTIGGKKMTNHYIVETDSGGEKHWLLLRCRYCCHIFEAPKTDTICPKCSNGHRIYCGIKESPQTQIGELTVLIEKTWREYQNLQDQYRKLTGKEHGWLK